MNKNTFWKKYTRPFICLIIVLVFFTMFIIRLVDWQLIQGDYYREEVSTRANYVLTSDATRGEIVDVNGEVIAANTTNYTVVLDKLYINSDMHINDVITEMFELLSHRDVKWIDNLPIIMTAGGYGFTEYSEDELESLRSGDFLDLGVYSTAEEYLNAFAKRYDVEDMEDKTLQRNIISVRYNMEIEGFSATTPYTFAEHLDEDTVAIISETSQNKPYMDIVTTYDRVCVDGTLMPHLLGNTGPLTAEEYEENSEKGYAYNDIIGKYGIELAAEDYLKGHSGTKTVSKTSDGTVVSVVDVEPAKPGDTVYLTINNRLQRVANSSLAENVVAARQAGIDACIERGDKLNGEDCTAGAAVMLSVKDFSVLACASYPTFDLTRYSDGDYYTTLLNDKTLPLYDRALSGAFAPGSVVKPIVALAALEEGVVSEYTPIYCSQTYDYYPSNVVNCMYYHGSVDMASALMQSCNYYFADLGRQLGIETMYLYFEKVGLGEYTGVEVGESKGTLAGRDSYSWTPGNTVQAAIGQSDNNFTPMQLATYAATIANNGVRYRTHMIDKITTYDRSKVVFENDPNKPEVVDKLDVNSYNLKVVQNAMRNVVASDYGTAYYSFLDFPISVAGKTGTAENSGSDHCVFICYAPFEKPEVAVAVLLEHGAKGMYAMDVAKDLLNAYFFPEEVSETTSATE
ncbi:MAG: penicillin-binding protein [Clostridia bacterium]|nr:penicillin-binding protein [Clostridia bacterium]